MTPLEEIELKLDAFLQRLNKIADSIDLMSGKKKEEDEILKTIKAQQNQIYQEITVGLKERLDDFERRITALEKAAKK